MSETSKNHEPVEVRLSRTSSLSRSHFTSDEGLSERRIRRLRADMHRQAVTVEACMDNAG